eukprot:TRINITY_DN6773_c0_g2_i1.p1 TRINITY_DN6773_c0_g2~~TRINITY_DN6773_c0_g2_i1.p1  ORF type:complete len:521 (+),score=114.11 TRINITY_DN6773_c0_g2_i1:124-1563(+)
MATQDAKTRKLLKIANILRKTDEAEDFKVSESHKNGKVVHSQQFMTWLKKHNPRQYRKETKKLEQLNDIRKWFNFIDADGSGEISVDELLDPLISMGLARNRGDVENLIAKVDDDQSGEIGFEEFATLLGSSSTDKEENPIVKLYESLASGALGDRTNLNIASLISAYRRNVIMSSLMSYGGGSKVDAEKDRKAVDAIAALHSELQAQGDEDEEEEENVIKQEKDLLLYSKKMRKKLDQREKKMRSRLTKLENYDVFQSRHPGHSAGMLLSPMRVRRRTETSQSLDPNFKPPRSLLPKHSIRRTSSHSVPYSTFPEIKSPSPINASGLKRRKPTRGSKFSDNSSHLPPAAITNTSQRTQSYHPSISPVRQRKPMMALVPDPKFNSLPPSTSGTSGINNFNVTSHHPNHTTPQWAIPAHSATAPARELRHSASESCIQSKKTFSLRKPLVRSHKSRFCAKGRPGEKTINPSTRRLIAGHK